MKKSNRISPTSSQKETPGLRCVVATTSFWDDIQVNDIVILYTGNLLRRLLYIGREQGMVLEMAYSGKLPCKFTLIPLSQWNMNMPRKINIYNKSIFMYS